MTTSGPRGPQPPDRRGREPSAIDEAAGYAALNGWFREPPPQPVMAMADNTRVSYPARPPMGPTPVPPPPMPPAPRKRRSLWRTVKRILLIILVVLLAYFGTLAWYTSANINRVEALPADRIGNTSGAVYLLVGSDSRAGAEDLNTGEVEGQRTDTIIMLHVPLLGPPTLVSVPRDSLVEIPGYGQGKVNAAYNIGGPQLLIQTLEGATGLRVDHYVEIGFNGIVGMTDAVGGVTVCLDYDVDDYNSGLTMAAGCHEVDGETALAYVRMRYADPEGDIGRVERQQEFLAAFMAEVMQPSTLLNPAKAFSVAEASASALTVDEDTGVIDLSRFAVAFGLIAKDRGELTTVPIADPAGWYNGESVVIWDEQGAADLFASLGA